MGIYLHKLLPLIISPLFLIFLILIGGVILKSRKISIIGIVILIIFSLPFISMKLYNYLEKDYYLKDVSNIEATDAIVVLSGMVSTTKIEDKYKYEFGGAVDRILSGIELFKSKKAPFLILTRGKLPWQEGLSEGEYLKEFAVKFGIPRENILLTEIVQNTEEEAKSVRKILNKDNTTIILVTSAFHMPRAKKVFEASSIKVVPFAVDFNSYRRITFLDFLPSANSLSQNSHFVREIMARIYYHLKY